MTNIDFDSYLNLVDENFYGKREDWITLDGNGQRGGTDVFYDEYYPKYKIGKAGNLNNGRLIDYYDAGIIHRDLDLNESIGYVNTTVHCECMEFSGFHNDPVDPDYGEPTDWEAYSSMGGSDFEVPIIFQAYNSVGEVLPSSGATGINGYFVPTDFGPSLANWIKALHGGYRYSDQIDLECVQEHTISCENETARYALTPSDVGGKSYVYEEDTQHYYFIYDREKLDRAAGYMFCASKRDFLTNTNMPIVSFCPKNFIMEIRVSSGPVWTDGTTATARPDSLPAFPSDTSSSNESLSTFISKIPQRVHDIEEYNRDYPGTNNYKAVLVVRSVWGLVYKRKEYDKFTAIQGGSAPYRPMPNIMFNFPLMFGTFGGSGNYVNYGFNQNVNTGANTYFTLPIFGTPSTGGTGGNVYVRPISTVYNTYYNFYDANTISYWLNHKGGTTALFSTTAYYPRDSTSVSDGREGNFLIGHSDNVPKLTTYVWKQKNVSDAIEYFVEQCHQGAAKYGLFFCDDYDSLTNKDTPKVWVDENMMCSTITLDRGGERRTWGDYTSGIDNMDQPQFWWVDSEGHTWNPETTFQTNGDDYPTMGSWDMIPLPVMPYPYPIYETANSYPNIAKWDTQLIGAFAGVKSLGSTVIPRTVTEIGYNAFAGTSLTEVTISENCEYSAESFPKNCEVKFYS